MIFLQVMMLFAVVLAIFGPIGLLFSFFFKKSDGEVWGFWAFITSSAVYLAALAQAIYSLKIFG